MAGYWHNKGAPALVNWCEADYSHSPWVAEWFNSLSSLAMVIIAFVGLYSVRNAALRFRLGMLGLVAIGAGSASFHATLLRSAQAADELPMLWLGLGCVWALVERARPAGEGSRLAGALVAFGLAFTAAYLVVPWAFGLFVAVYAAMIGWVALRTIQLTWWRPSTPAMRRAASWMVGGYLGTFLLAWLPEHVLLPCEHPLQALHLHSFWHLGAGVGTVAWWRWALADRQALLGEGG